MADRNQFADAVERWEPDMKPRRSGRPLHATDATGEMREVAPSLRSKVAGFLGGLMPGGDSRENVQGVHKAMGSYDQGLSGYVNPALALDLSPYETGRAGAEAVRGRRYDDAVLQAATSVPGVGKAAAGAVKYGPAVLSGIIAAKMAEKLSPSQLRGMGNQLNVLIGTGGLAIDKKALNKAQAMLAGGKSADQIWADTRWEQVLPNQWLTEIPDTPGAYATPPQGTQALGGFYQEPGFYANYPEFANMRYKRLYGGPHEGGQYDFADPTISINPKRTQEQQRDTFYHELMHGVQHKEYWPSGSSLERAASQMKPGTPGWEIFVNKLDEMRKNTMSWDQFNDQFANATKEQYGHYLEDVKQTGLDWDDPLVQWAERLAAFESYRRDPGEWLARIASQRAGMSELNKRLNRPGRSADLPVSLVHPAGVPRKWVAPKAPPADWPY